MMKHLENKRLEIEIKKPVRGYPAGTKIKILTNKDEIPLDRYWRDRLKDSKIDGCISIIEKKQNKKKRSTED